MTLDQEAGASSSFNKLMRTFAAQIEALKRHRSAGEQNVVVKHVHVYPGGQAVVGNVNTGGGWRTKVSDNLMNLEMQPSKLELMRRAPRCSATSKRTGMTCRAPAVKGKRVCRVHGAHGGAPSGERNGMYSHGRCTNEARANFRSTASLLRAATEMLRNLESIAASRSLEN